MIDDEHRAHKLAQTVVWHGDDAFLVSTCTRRSSALRNPEAIYAETLVWEWFPQAQERGRLIGQDSASAYSIHAHQRMVQRLFDTGQCEVVGVNEV